MKDHFDIRMESGALGNVSVLGLAHIGDAVYELLVRTWLCETGKTTSAGLHRATVARVRAQAQAKAAEKLLPGLTEAELAVYRRGRNAKVHSVPKNAGLSEYHAATGLEALFGWLYLKGGKRRINELFSRIMEE
ncbi:MAG: ribonuclease III [Oscillospiraceae bacterium]|jgi:ribonuclease-3 family protein|nr:ribonuclease III [Oscillospiraceae bacterium]